MSDFVEAHPNADQEKHPLEETRRTEVDGTSDGKSLPKPPMGDAITEEAPKHLPCTGSERSGQFSDHPWSENDVDKSEHWKKKMRLRRERRKALRDHRGKRECYACVLYSISWE